MTDQEGALELAMRGFRRGRIGDGYLPVDVITDRGEVGLRYYPVVGATTALVCIGGAGGGWDSPGCGELYPQLCGDMSNAGIAALRVRYRQPTVLEESVLDVLAGFYLLADDGICRIGIVGHSFGAAVAAQAAANGESVRALVAIAAQSDGLGAVRDLPAGCASLFVHGAEDGVLPPSCSQHGYSAAREPRYLRIFGGAGHCLDEVADQLRAELRNWLLTELKSA